MANTKGTIGTTLRTLGPALSAVPFAGPFLSMGATIGGGLLEQSAANDQLAQAKKEREDALNTQKQPIRPEFMQKLRMDKMNALSGLPGFDNYNELIDQGISDNLRDIRESSNSGAATLATMSALLAKGNQQKRELMAQDSAFRNDARKQVGNTLWDIGLKQRDLENIRDDQMAEGLQSASALENAGTYNKINALNKIFGAVGSTATGITNNIQTQERDKGWDEFYKQWLLSQNPPTQSSTGSNMPLNPFMQYQTATPGFWK